MVHFFPTLLAIFIFSFFTAGLFFDLNSLQFIFFPAKHNKSNIELSFVLIRKNNFIFDEIFVFPIKFLLHFHFFTKYKQFFVYYLKIIFKVKKIINHKQ